MNRTQSIPTLNSLPLGLQQDGAINLELEQGVLILRASPTAQARIEFLLQKQNDSPHTPDEEQELQQYEDVDDYLSYLNRLTRNLAAAQTDTADNCAA